MSNKRDEDKSAAELIWEIRKLRQQLARQDAAKAEEIDLISQILQTANATLDLDEVVAKVMEALHTIFDFNQISIFLFNAQTNCLEVTNWYGAGYSPEIKARFEAFPLSIDWDDVYFIKAFLDNEPFCVSPITPKLLEYYSPRDRQMFEWNPHTAIACFPLQVLDKVIGIINFLHTDKSIDLNGDDMARIQRYVGQIATTINHAYLVRKTQYALKEAQSREREIRHINTIVEAANTSLDFDDVFQAILSGLRDVFFFDALGIQLAEEREDQLNIFRVYGDFITPEQLSRYRAIPIKASCRHSVSSFVFKTGETAYYPNITPDMPFSPTDKAIYDIIPFVSYLASPLKVQQKTIGVISFFCRDQPLALDDQQLARIQRYILSLSTAIYNAKNYEALRQSHANFRFLHETTTALQRETDATQVFQLAINRLHARYADLSFGLVVKGEHSPTIDYAAFAGIKAVDQQRLSHVFGELGRDTDEPRLNSWLTPPERQAPSDESTLSWHLFPLPWSQGQRYGYLLVKSAFLSDNRRMVISAILEHMIHIAETKHLILELEKR